MLPVLGAALLLFSPQSGDSERNYSTLQAPAYAFGKEGPEIGAFRAPRGLAIVGENRLYVADSGNHRIQVFSLDGTARASFGSAELLFPGPLAAAADGTLYVADLGHGRIQVYDPDGRPLRSWGAPGDVVSPGGLAVVGDTLYVTDSELNRVRAFSLDGRLLRSFGEYGAGPGQFKEPSGIAADADGTLYVADTVNHRIQKLDAEGRPLAQWGAWGAHAGLLSFPCGIGVHGDRVYVADSANHRVQVFDRSGVLHRQWGAAPVKPLDGQGRLHFPELLALNPSGGMTVVAEPGEHRLQVFVNREHPSTSRVNDVPWWDGLHARLHALRLAPPPTGAPPQVFAAVAAVDVHAVYFFDVSSAALGPLATLGGFGRKLGELNHVAGVASDSSRGRAWVSDRGNRRLQLLELQRDGERPELFSGIVRVVATRAIDAFLPGRLALDAANQLYLLDRSRGEIQVYDAAMEPVRRIPVGFGVVDFAVNRDGRPVVLDAWRCELRTLEADGKPRSSFGRRGETGDDAFLLPGGVAVDDQGLVYVTDQLLHDVRKFDPAGKLLARWGKPGRFVETLWGPRGVAVEKPGRVVVEDVGNHRAAVFATDGRYLGAYVTGGLTSPMGIR